MEIYDYTTSGGKNLIMEYIEKLPDALKAESLDTRKGNRGVCFPDYTAVI